MDSKPVTVEIVSYRGTIYGVFSRFVDAYEFAKKEFGEGAVEGPHVVISNKVVK